MIELYARSKRELHYDARWFLQMVAMDGAVQAARQLVMSDEPAYGFTKLWELDRLDLSVEYQVLQPPWAPLFSEDAREAARARLRQYGTQV